MIHSFKLKKSIIKTAFENKLGIKSISIENKTDVFNAIFTALNFIELEDYLIPIDCTYNFVNNHLVFQLKLAENKEKNDFFKSIKTFEAFLGL